MAKQKNNRAKARKTNPYGNNTMNRQNHVTPGANQAFRMTNTRPAGPRITSRGAGLVIRNKELYGSVSSDLGGLTLAGVALNPASATIFPWLSAIVRRYGYYRWKKLNILYSSACPTTQRGLVTMGTFYDVEDRDSWVAGPGATAIQRLTQTVGSTQGPVWGSTITCHPNMDHTSEIQTTVDVNRAHIRTPWHIVDVLAAGDATTNQSIAVFLGWVTDPNAVANGTVCGSIWFDYEIELVHPTSSDSNQALRGTSLEEEVIVHLPLPAPTIPPSSDDPREGEA